MYITPEANWEPIDGWMRQTADLPNGAGGIADDITTSMSDMDTDIKIIESDGENEIILYQPDATLSLDVRVENETVWLNRNQIALLFDRDVKTIGKHINNALKEELEDLSVVAKFATTAADGKTYQVEDYNIEMITSVGYRVKSRRGVQFRQWANKVLKDYLLRGYSFNQRLSYMENRIDRRLLEHDKRLLEATRSHSLSAIERISWRDWSLPVNPAGMAS